MIDNPDVKKAIDLLKPFLKNVEDYKMIEIILNGIYKDGKIDGMERINEIHAQREGV